VALVGVDQTKRKAHPLHVLGDGEGEGEATQEEVLFFFLVCGGGKGGSGGERGKGG